MLKSLTERYSCRAREFADTVALLGSHHTVGPEVLKLFKEIQRKRLLCIDAEMKLGRYLQSEDDESKAARQPGAGRWIETFPIVPMRPSQSYSTGGEDD